MMIAQFFKFRQNTRLSQCAIVLKFQFLMQKSLILLKTKLFYKVFQS